MKQSIELKNLFNEFQDGTLTEEDVSKLVWDEYDHSVDHMGKLDQIEQFGRMLTNALLTTVYKIKLREVKPLDELKSQYMANGNGHRDEGRIFNLSQIKKLIDGCVTHATLINHLKNGKLKGERLSQRRTEIKEGALLKYIADYHPRKLGVVKEKLMEIE